MKCALCNETIDKYSPTFNHLQIDEQRDVNICRECIDKFMRWQQNKLARLFPTRTLKMMYGENRKER
jgi:hypothetical protein